MGDAADADKPPSGCGGLLLSVFRRGQPPRRSTSAASIPSAASPKLSPSNSKRPRSGSDEASLLQYNPPLPAAPRQPAPPPGRSPNTIKTPNGQNCARITGISTELETMIHDHQRSNNSSALVRASSGNVMVFSHLGNIRAPGAVTPNRNVLDYLPKTAREKASDAGDKQAAAATVVNLGRKEDKEPDQGGVMCRALSRRLDPEELKEMGNEEYKNGRFAEAVALYDRAILIDPERAVYWSNKAAALTGLGQLLEAVGECREAVRIDPSYHRAHHRLATLYVRLGDAEKALHHFKLSRNEASAKDISQVQTLHTHISKYKEARKLKDWNAMLREAESAVSSGADSAPQVIASRAEALLMLRRHEEAEKAFSAAPKFSVDESTKFFGPARNAYVLSVRAQVDIAAGRFEDAVSTAQLAVRIDPGSREISLVARKARAMAMARSRGNDLFKASKFEEACFAYGEGLDHDSYNSILLCNRAACRTKLGQLDKAIEDCNASLRMRPSYSKARLRRADCNAKLGRWEAAVQDYEVLANEMPGDENVQKALHEAQLQLKKQQGDEFGLTHITTKDQFKQIVASRRLSVVLFFNKSSDASKRMSSMEQLCKQYRDAIFLKVDTEEVPDLARSEGVNSVPSFRIYKDGSIVKDIGGSDYNQLESSIKLFTT